MVEETKVPWFSNYKIVTKQLKASRLDTGPTTCNRAEADGRVFIYGPAGLPAECGGTYRREVDSEAEAQALSLSAGGRDAPAAYDGAPTARRSRWPSSPPPRGDRADPLHRLRRRRALPPLLHRRARRRGRPSRRADVSSRSPTAGSSSTSAAARPTTSRRSPSRRRADPDRVSSFLNIRVADIAAVYAEWSARGAEFLTPPKQHETEIRCYIRDPDGHLIEVGQTTRARPRSGTPGSGSRSGSRRPTRCAGCRGRECRPASFRIRARCSMFQAAKVVLRLVKSFSGPPEPSSR